MAIDPKQMTPTQLVRTLNSTPLGSVTSGAAIHRQMNEAGTRVGDGKRVHLVRYVAWLARKVHMARKAKTAQTEAAPSNSGYESVRERSRARQAEISQSGRDIGPIPAVADPKRRAKAEKSLKAWCETYMPATFNLPWSDDHLKALKRLDRVIDQDELYALAMPRGTGKTTMLLAAVLKAKLTGKRRFGVLIGDTEMAGVELIEAIKTELETNELLAADYPEVCYPIERLERITQRAKGQLCEGRPTRMSWTKRQIVLPTIPGSPASGAVIHATGLTGRLRGLKHSRSDGEAMRPDMVLLDDPQTDESARSPTQTQQRERLVNGAVLGLAGPSKPIAALMACTVICKDDLADRILDRGTHPEWHGERFKLIYQWPTNEKLWDQYAELRAEGLLNDDGGKAATTFYRKHRKEMDAGAKVAWPQRKLDSELSAIQHAVNLRLRNEAAFLAEHQNEPPDEHAASELRLLDDEIFEKIGGVGRGVVPMACDRLTAFIDVQQKVLWYLVAAWGDGFTGAVVDYGTWPDQGLGYVTTSAAKRTIARAKPGAGFEGQLYNALGELVDQLAGTTWKNEKGTQMQFERVMIDANWGKSTDVVYQFARESTHKSLVLPSHGRGIGASMKPLNEYQKKPGDRVGHYWRIAAASGRGARYVVYDTNYWKTFLSDRIRASLGDRGAIQLYKAKPTQHRMLVDHLTSEYPIEVSGRGRSVQEWKLRPGRENHLFDCLVGAAVAASMLNVATIGHQTKPAGKRRRKGSVSYL